MIRGNFEVRGRLRAYRAIGRDHRVGCVVVRKFDAFPCAVRPKSRNLVRMRYCRTLETFVQRWAFVCVWLVAFVCAFGVTGCGSVTTEPESTESADLQFVKEKLRPLCFKPSEVAVAEANGDNDIFFAFVETTGEAVTSRDRWVLDQALFQDGFVFKYDVDAPIANLKLVPIRDSALGVDPAFQAQAGPRTRPSGSNSGVPPARA